MKFILLCIVFGFWCEFGKDIYKWLFKSKKEDK